MLHIADMRADRRRRQRPISRRRVIATRGERLALARVRLLDRDQCPTSVRRRGARHRRDRRRRADRRVVISSTSTTSTPPSKSSTPGTSPAKRPPTRTRGRSSHGPTPRSTGTNFPRRRTGSSSTTGRSHRSTRVICLQPSAPFGTSRRTSASTSRRCIGSAALERSSPIRRMGPRQKASTPSGE